MQININLFLSILNNLLVNDIFRISTCVSMASWKITIFLFNLSTSLFLLGELYRVKIFVYNIPTFPRALSHHKRTRFVFYFLIVERKL
jgi:hypothetical protein